MLRLFGRITLAVYALSLQACSDEPLSGPLGGEQMTAGGGGSGAGLSPGGAAGQAQAGAGGAVVFPVKPCTDYTDATGWSLLVQIKNEMSQTLYLGQEATSCAAERLFQVADGARTLLPALDGCRSSCETMMKTGPVVCPTVCAAPATVTLEPGQTVRVPWDGRFGVDEALPQQCLLGAQTSNLACVRAQRIEASLFTFSAKAGTQRQCLEPSGTCSCTPSATGGCTSPGLIGGTIITTELILKLEPGESEPGGEPPFIGLVFREQPQ